MKMFLAVLLSIVGTVLVSCSDQDSSSLKKSVEPLKSALVASNTLDDLPLEDQTKKVEKHAPLNEEDGY